MRSRGVCPTSGSPVARKSSFAFAVLLAWRIISSCHCFRTSCWATLPLLREPPPPQGVPSPTPGPHGGRTIPQTPILEGVQERHEDPGPAGPDRMADGDRTAMDVDLRVVDLELSLTGDDLDGKGLVDLKQVDVLHLQSSLLYGLSRRRDRAHRHDGRLDVGPAPPPAVSPENSPAVPAPPSRKIALSLASLSSVVSGRGCSSWANRTGSPLACGMETGMISSLNFPVLIASAALCWLIKACRSCSSRLILNFSAIRSPRKPMRCPVPGEG